MHGPENPNCVDSKSLAHLSSYEPPALRQISPQSTTNNFILENNGEAIRNCFSRIIYISEALQLSNGKS